MITVLTGEDQQRADHLKSLIGQFLAENEGLAIKRQPADEVVDLIRLKADLASSSLFVPSQLIVLDHLQAASWLTEKSLKEVLAAVDPTNHLVIVFKKNNPAPAWQKLLANQANYHDFKKLDDWATKNWLAKRAKDYNCQWSPILSETLIGRCGLNLVSLNSELIKLSWHDQINPELIEKIVSKEVSETKDFALTNALSQKNLKEAKKSTIAWGPKVAEGQRRLKF